jgi:arabinose-5-phosphate isomerase
MSSADWIIDRGRRVLEVESLALNALQNLINESFVDAVRIIYQTNGRVIITGVGKSGLIGKKIAASFASLGTPAFFVHPVEALHGDLGMITHEDILLIICNSGETKEILDFVSYLLIIFPEIQLIALTGRSGSHLGKISAINIVTGVSKEADSFNLAPTASTLAALAVGDALAVTLADMKKFSRSIFKQFHPGGDIGDQLRSITTTASSQ